MKLKILRSARCKLHKQNNIYRLKSFSSIPVGGKPILCGSHHFDSNASKLPKHLQFQRYPDAISCQRIILFDFFAQTTQNLWWAGFKLQALSVHIYHYMAPTFSPRPSTARPFFFCHMLTRLDDGALGLFLHLPLTVINNVQATRMHEMSKFFMFNEYRESP